MQRYIQQIIFDIKLAESKVPDEIRNRKNLSKDGIENALIEAEFKPLQDWIGIPKSIFPPIEQLNVFQIDVLLRHLIALLKLYGYVINVPQHVPNQVLYIVLVNHLSAETPLLPNHSWQLALCGYDVQKCPFGQDHCQCKDWENILLEFPGMIDQEGLNFINAI